MRVAKLILVFAVLSLMPALDCRVAQGQWLVGLEVGSDRYWGGSEESAPEHRSFRPYRPTTLGVGLIHGSGNVGAGVRFRYSSAPLALEGTDALVAAKGVFDVYTVAPEVWYRVAGLASNELLVQAGPLLEVWSILDGGSETRFGGHIAASMRVPLGGRVVGWLSAGLAVIPSPFTVDQLDPGFERRALWRRRVAGGVEYRL
jgi:hypothetical protein